MFNQEAHKEHSTETQMPFVQYYFDNIEVVEIIYGKIDYKNINELIDFILKDEENAIVISTDLSHFYTQENAKKLDTICVNAMAKLDNNILNKGCEACGIIGVKAMIESASKAGFQSKVLDYRTSYDTTGDDSRVVGYCSCVIG